MKITVFLVVISVLLPKVIFGQESLSLSQIIARHNSTQERLNRCTLATEERWMMTQADGTPEQILSVRRCKIRIDGGRSNLLVDEVNYPSGVTASAPGEQGYVNEFNYVCNDQVLQIYYPHDEFHVRPKNPAGVNGRLSPQLDDEFYVQTTIGNAAIAFGRTTFFSPIAIANLILRSKVGTVTSDDYGYCVEGTTPDGTRYKIWFDPKSGFVIRKLLFEQSGNALHENRFQYNRRILTSRYGFGEKAVVSSVNFEIRNVEVEPWKDTYVVTSLEAIKTVTAEDGAKAVERTTHHLKDWNLEPDFSDPSSFQPWLPVPEGTHVTVEDNDSLEYCYKDKKIELVVHEKTVQALKKIQMLRRPTQPRVQWSWAVVASVLGITWWRMRSG